MSPRLRQQLDLLGQRPALGGQRRARAAPACPRSPGARTPRPRGGRPSAPAASRPAPAAARRARSARPSGGTAARAARPRRRRTARPASVRSASSSSTSRPRRQPPSRRRGLPRGHPREPVAEAVHALAGARAGPRSSRRPGSPTRGWPAAGPGRSPGAGSRSILFTTTSSQVRNMSGYLSGLSSPSVTEHTIALASSPTRNSAGQTRLPTFSMISRSISSSGDLRQRRAHHVRVEVALAAEAAVGVQLGDRHVEAGQAVGVEAALHVALQHARRARRPALAGAPPRAAWSCPRPARSSGSPRATDSRSKSARLAWAIVVFASSASSATLTLVRCMLPPPPRRSTPRRTRCRVSTSTSAPPQRRAAEDRLLERPSSAPQSSHRTARRPRERCRAARPRTRVSRVTISQ